MKLNLIGPFIVNAPFGTEIAFEKGLRRMGHEVNPVDPNVTTYCSPDADATVVFKSCVDNEDVMLSGLSHPIVVYQPDDARFPHIREMMLKMRQYSDLFLSFDEHGAEVAKTMRYKAAETLLLTADYDLYCPSKEPIERDIDVSFIGSLGDPVAHASRRRMIEIVQAHANKRGWVTAFGTTQDIPQILDVYRRSKVVLNHATDVGQSFGTGYGLQCRHFEVGMTRTCLLSNLTLGDKLDPIPYVIFSDEHSLIRQLEYLLEDDTHWEEGGELLHTMIMLNHKPEHRAKQLVDFIERNK